MRLAVERRKTLVSLIMAVLLHLGLIFISLPDLEFKAGNNRAGNEISVVLERSLGADRSAREQVARESGLSESAEKLPELDFGSAGDLLATEPDSAEPFLSKSVTHSSVRQWVAEYVNEQALGEDRHINISQPRTGSLTRIYMDAAEQRRKAREAPAKYQYASGVVRSLRWGNKEYCFLMSALPSPVIIGGFQIQRINCGQNLWHNPLIEQATDSETARGATSGR